MVKPRTFLRQIRNELKHLEPGMMDPNDLYSVETEITQYLYKTDKRHNRVSENAR